VAIRIDICESTKGHADIPITTDPLIKAIIKALQHDIVVMQDVDPVTSRPLNASIPSIH
jgi:hypothetical protein